MNNIKEDIFLHIETFKSGFAAKVADKSHRKRNPALWNKVLELTDFLPDTAYPNQRFWHILNDKWSCPLDPITGEKTLWKNRNYCSTRGLGSGCKTSYTKAARKITSLKKYGVDNPAKTQAVKDKMASTNLEKYGHINYFGSIEGIQCVKNEWADSIKREQRLVNIKKAQFEKYGCWPYQNQDVFDKAMLNGMKYRHYTMPSGEIVQIQGYEKFALDDLFEAGFLENEIIIGRRKLPEIWYQFNGQQKRYYPDIYIPGCNLFIEVKSTFSYTYEEAKNLAKQAEVLSRGYNFEFLIYSANDVKSRLRKEK